MEKSLIESNPYLRDPEQRRRLLMRNAWESSVFEGADLEPLEHYLKHYLDSYVEPESLPASKASTKKSVKAA